MEENLLECLISVIIPVYNSEKYIAKCLESVINQSYHNIEILLIDDGSKDLSLSIIDYYAKMDDRIRIISNLENKGISYVRQLGLNLSKGKYIIYIDSDDYV